MGLVQYFSEHATEEFARVSADAGFWAKWAYSQTDELEQRLEVREQQRTSDWPADPDKYLHSKWLAAARLTTIAATSFAGRDDVAGPLTEVLEDLTDALQIRDELSTLVSDLELGRPTYPIAFVAKAAGIPLAPWPDTNEVLGAMIATGSVEAMREAAVGRIGHASARAVEADLHTFVEYLEDAIESLQDRLARPMGGVLLPAPSGRRAHPATATGRSEAVVGDALAMAAGFLLSDRTFKESWESHREGMFGADLVASRFPAGMIMEILSVHGHDVAAEIDGFQAFAVANRFRYFDHPHSGIDTDTLGLYLRLCAYAKKRDAAIDAARPLLACLERNIRQRGSVPVWLGGCDDGVDTRPPVLDLGEGCATVAAHLLIGLSTVQPTDNFDVLELGAGALLQRISTEGMSANVNYPPLFALGTFFRLIRSLVGLPASGELQTRAEVAQATLLTELERATRARVLSAQDAALLIAACDLADRRELVRPAWRSIVLQHQRFDGSWRGEPFFAAPNRGRYVTWYESTLLTSALCYDALVRSSG